MPYVSDNHLTRPSAPLGQWCSTRTSSLDPYSEEPAARVQGSPSFPGQCISYPCKVCSTLPVNTSNWVKGGLAKGDSTVPRGTAMATIDANGRFDGHGAIYKSQSAAGINVVDPWVSGNGKAIGPRVLGFGGRGHSNNGDSFHVID